MAVRQLGTPADLETPRPLPARSPVPERISAVAATADLSRVAVATAAPWSREFSDVLLLAEGAVTRLAVPGRRGVLDLVFDPDGSALTAMDDGNSIYRWRLGAPGERWCLGMIGSGGPLDLPLAQAAAGGRSFATANAFTQNVVVWDAATRRALHDIHELFKDHPYDDRVKGEGTVALSADGSRLAFSRPRRTFWTEDEGVVVLEVDGGAHVEHRTGIHWANGLAFGPDGAALVVVGTRPGDDEDDVEHETVATVVDLDNPATEPEPVVLPTGEPLYRTNLRPVWSGAEPRVPIIGRSHVDVWNLATASVLLSVRVPGPRTAAALTPDGRALVVASPDDGVHAHPLP